MDFLVRTCDKVSGVFYADATGLSPSVCGGLTASLTIGLALGVTNAAAFDRLSTGIRNDPEALERAERDFLRAGYRNAAWSATALAVGALAPLPSTVEAAVLVAASGVLAYSVSFPFYNLPARFSKEFGENQSVCMSLMDALGFFVCAPVWATTGRLVGGGEDDNLYGWAAVWIGLAAVVCVSSRLMESALPTILRWEERRETMLLTEAEEEHTTTTTTMAAAKGAEVL